MGRSGPDQYLLLTPFYSQGSVWDEIDRFNADPIRVWPFTEARCLRIFEISSHTILCCKEQERMKRLFLLISDRFLSLMSL